MNLGDRPRFWKHSKLLAFASVFIMIFILCFGISRLFSYHAKDYPKAKKGVLDLSHWDIVKDGHLRLDGEWEFYWDQLLEPEDFKKGKVLPMSGYIKLPAVWNGFQVRDEKTQGHGFATYRLKINNYHGDVFSGIKPETISSAYKLWVNGEEILSGGKVGRNKADTIPFFNTTAGYFKTEGSELEIIIQVSNYAYGKGGIWDSVRIGTSQQIKIVREIQIATELFLVGALAIIALYYLSFYVYRRKETVLLYFSLACLTIAVRTLVVGGSFISVLLPPTILNWYLAKAAEYISFYAVPFFLVKFYHSLFPKEFPKKLVSITTFFSIVFILQVLALPFKIYSDTIVVFQGFVVGLVVVSFVSMIIATIRGRDGAVISLLGSIVFFITAINDVLYALQVIYTTNLVPWGLIVFVFVQAFIMSRKSSSTFSKVEELSERLLALDKLKDDFLANTSHELRTPLNGIIGIAESLLGGAAGQLNNQQRYNLHLIVTSGKRLACLVKDILDFLRLKNKDVKIYKRPVDLRQVAAMVLELSRPLLGEKRIELRNEIDESIPLIYADENRLEQILHNLLGNAIKFTHEGKVTLSACVRGTMVQVNVADTGIGIPKTMFAKIFNPFEQVDSSIQREYGGTGLGLNITKSLVELHGGEMNLESEVGCGSMFSFTIPVYDGGIIQQSSSPAGNYQNTVPSVEEASFEALAARHPLNDSQPSFKILVVDDEAINVQVLSNQLALSNYRVVTASNGEEALKIIQESHCEPFNLIILDIMMPKVSGFEVCRILRKKYSMLELPVLMLTAKDQPEDIAAGYEAGANDYLAKPFNKSELLARVNTLLTLESSVKFSIANARKLESEWTGRLMAERINDFTKSLTATLEPEEVAKRILSNILDIVPSEKGLIILRDGDNFKVAAVNNQDSPLVATGDEIKARDSKLLMELMETLKPVIRNDSVAVLYPKDILLGLAGSVIGIPVIYNGIMSGSILLICKSEGAYKDFEYSIEIASNFANQAGIAIENARLFAEVRKLAVRDGLTGLYSRRHFFQLAEQEFNKSRRYSSPFTIVMLDIDYFKRINDTYGHNVGDEVLKHVSQKCSDSVRKSDIVGRYGGEELIILLPETEIENAKLMAEKLRKTIEEAPITDENGNKICVTASFGVAMVTGNTASLNDAIIKADMGLYEAKRGGRNKVVAL